MQNSLFSVTGDDLRRLDAGEAVTLVSHLLWAEAMRLGIPVSKIHISSQVDSPDGGVDAIVSDHTASGDLIRVGRMAYQIKSGESFRPNEEAVIRKELFGKKKTAKANLKRRIRDCLDDGGTYGLVCTGIDPVDLSVAEAHLKKFFDICGYADAKCAIWVQNQLCGILSKYPSIALQVNGREPGRLRSQIDWAHDAEMAWDFHAGAEQTKFISDLTDALRASGNAVHVHVRGEAGIGKTRLVLEVTRRPDFKPLVLYTNKPSEFLEGEFLATFAREDNQFTAILVVDECGADYRTQIWNRLKSRGQRVKLVTIFNEWEDASGVSFLDAPLLDRDNIVRIIESYGIAKDQAERFADFCSGSPRVAHVVGFNLHTNPEDLLKPTDTINIWDRYVVGVDDAGSAAVKDRFTVLRCLALFKRFGYGGPVSEEAKSISAIIQNGFPHITWVRFQEVVSDLRRRKILQGETTLYITPKMLHVRLWVDWWNNHGNGFDIEEFAAGLKGNLLPWFLEMFRYAEQSQAARKVVSSLLGPEGPFHDKDFLKSRMGGDFFLALTDVDSKQALACLQRTVGTWPREELLDFRDGRRGVVWALQRIVMWKDNFSGAAKLLLKLAEAESETWSNNATGVFAELFSLGHGDTAPTEAPPQERLPVLEEALLSDSEMTRAIALKACDAGLEALHFSRVAGAEHQGFKPKPQLWTPETWGEIWGAYRQIWTLVRRQLPTLTSEQRRQAVQILLNKGGAISLTTNLWPLILETWREILDNNWATKAELLGHLASLLRFHRNELTPELITHAESFRNELIGKDFSAQLKRYVAMDLVEDYLDDKNQPTDTRAKQIHGLAQQCAQHPELVRSEWSWLVTEEAKNGYPFGYELAKLDPGFSFLKEIIEVQGNPTPHSALFFLSGYMRAIFETEPSRWEDLLDEFVSDSRMLAHVPELTWRSGMTDRAAIRILTLAQSGQMEVGKFRMFCYGSVIKDLSEDVFTQWAEFLILQPDAVALRILVNLLDFYYLTAKAERKLPGDLTLRTLNNPAFFQKGSQFHAMDYHHWATVGCAFVSAYPDESLALAKNMIDHFAEEGTIVEDRHSEVHKVLIEITRLEPNETWRLLSRRIQPPIDSRAYRLKSWLRGDRFSAAGERGVLPLIPLEEIWKWVEGDRGERAWYLASFVPKELFRSPERPCLAREILIRYGAEPAVREALAANFSTEGWSGPASAHYQDKKLWLLDFKKDETDTNVKLWIDEYVEHLDKRIEDAKLREEREAF